MPISVVTHTLFTPLRDQWNRNSLWLSYSDEYNWFSVLGLFLARKGRLVALQSVGIYPNHMWGPGHFCEMLQTCWLSKERVSNILHFSWVKIRIFRMLQLFKIVIVPIIGEWILQMWLNSWNLFEFHRFNLQHLLFRI